MPEFTMDGLTEEQNKEVQAEIDRRVSEAVKTNTKNVTKEVTDKVTERLTTEFQERMDAAVAEAQTKAASTDQEKIAALEAALADQKAAFTKAQMERKTEQYLRDAGLAADSIAALTPLIVAGANEKTLDSTLEAFVESQKNAVEAALTEQKQALAANATPPIQTGNAYKPNKNEQLNAIRTQEGVDSDYADASAIQFLLNEAVAQ